MCMQVGTRGGAKCEAEGREASVQVRMEVIPVTTEHDAKDPLRSPQKTTGMFCFLDRQVPKSPGELCWPAEGWSRGWLGGAAWPQSLSLSHRLEDTRPGLELA